MIKSDWIELENAIQGELDLGNLAQIAYATDASVYRMKPLGVVFPKTTEDIVEVVKFASKHQTPIIPRTAGTSLAGQAIGHGLVVDVSKHMTQILEVNEAEKWVDVEPGVIRDVLNSSLRDQGLFFGPNTSTSSRCMIGGMVGNNSSGTTSIKYGTTRDKVLEVEAVLADGSLVTFGAVSDVQQKIGENDPGFELSRTIIELLEPLEVRNEIRAQYPKKTITRRNTGYALDVLINQQPFEEKGETFNLSKLIAGSEGTLCFITRIRLQLNDAPPLEESVICAHFSTIHDALTATVEIMKSAPYACELMDQKILELTKGNPAQLENRFFIEGNPAAILAIEVREETAEKLEKTIKQTVSTFQEKTNAYATPIVHAPNTAKVWALRAAGLGVLSNMPGDAKPIAFVEDTAVDVNDLPAYITEFEALMDGFDQEAVYYAHAGAGELHMRPILDLKTEKGWKDFRSIGEASARLVKKYNGSLSGEHGDGRVRAEFIPIALGEKNYELLKKMKSIWDPQGIFNPGKIVHADPVDGDFRYRQGQGPFSWPTFMNFGEENMLQAAERCNGSGDCRNPAEIGGTMCPSYQATKDELDSTRARANVLREVMTNPVNPAYPLDSDEVKEVLDLCLSCKACSRDCPSSVDMAALKAEAMFQYQRRHGVSKSSNFFGKFHEKAEQVWIARKLVNRLMEFKPFESTIKKRYEIAQERSIPKFSSRKASKLAQKYASRKEGIDFVLYIDEFTQYQDAPIAESAAKFFQKLGLNFTVIYGPSGRAAISKSLLKEARVSVQETLTALKPYLEKEVPVVGLEPSGILGFRDDIPKLIEKGFTDISALAKKHCYTFEEFVSNLVEKGKITSDDFTLEPQEIGIHLHCHQKSLSHIKHSKLILNLPKNFHAVTIPSGCCGMAGSFGFEEKHYQLSQSIGELILFPFVRKHPDKTIAASGTSCRHQISDGLSKEAKHPAQILLNALK